ncbi:beta-N-acetylhexosaminidase [soil metagenome]
MTASLGPVMLDVEGTALTEADRLRITHPGTGGVILFSRNFESRAQLTALTAEIHALRPGVLVTTDHEGGRVQRFKQDGFTVLPPAAALGRLWDRDESASRLLAVKAATAFGFVLASELRACGVDFSFTPVLDLAWGRSGVIGDRALHADPRVVTLLAKSLVHGLTLAGMAACGKHFPGHGHVEADSHFAVPVDDRPLDEILADDAAPYGWFGLGLPAVMPAHVVYPKVDDKPAGFSAIWLQQVLRNRLGYMGAILSDDLAMKGASPAGDVVAGAKAALKAGCDMVLVCNKPDWADQVLRGIDPALPAASQARLAMLQPMFAAPDWESLRASDRFAAAFRVLKGL